MSDGIIDLLQFAIDGTTTQQNSISNNISNVDTPDYTDDETSFQQSLLNAIQQPGDATASVTTTPSSNAPNADGNNVDLSSELVEAEQNTLQYQTITESLNAQFRLISGAAGGSFS